MIQRYMCLKTVDNMATLINGEPACNDDYCENSYQNFLSYIGGIQVFAGNTYYIVVDGYGSDYGEYKMNVYETDAALTFYNIYRDGDLVGEIPVPSYEENVGGGEGTYSYAVTSVYGNGMESLPSEEVTIKFVC